jgi:hypothetical protein
VVLNALSSNPELQKKNKKNGRPLYEPLQTRLSNPQEFLEATKRAKEGHDRGAFVAKHHVEEYENMHALIISEDGSSGIAITRDGDIENVFSFGSKTNGAAYTLFMLAIENGGMKGDNFNGTLTTMYTSMGAIPVSRTAFNREFAPKNWNYERDGEPDIIFWMLPNEPASVLASKIGTYPEPSIKDLPLFDSYDEAAAYRDSLLQERIERQDPQPTRQDLLKQLLREQFPNYNTGFINAYYNAAVQANIALMSLYFKDYGKFFELLSKMVTKKFIEKSMPDNLFDHLVDEYAMFYLSRFPFFNREDAREFIQNFPGDLQEQLDESPYLAGLELFKHVRVEGGRIAAAGLSYVDAQVKEKLTLDWEQLYTGEHRQLAVDLYRYAYFISGNNMSIETFYQLLPAYIKIHHVVDENGGTLANIEHNMLNDKAFSVAGDNDSYDNNMEKEARRFIHQFIMNNTKDGDFFADVYADSPVGIRLAGINDDMPHKLSFNLEERGARDVSKKRYIRLNSEDKKTYFRVLGKDEGFSDRWVDKVYVSLTVRRVTPLDINKFHVYDYFEEERPREVAPVMETLDEEDITETREAIIDYLSASLNPAARDFRDNLNELIIEAREQGKNPSNEHLEKIEEFFNTVGPLIKRDIHDILAGAEPVNVSGTNALDVLKPIYVLTDRRGVMPVDKELLQEVEERSKTLAGQLVIRTFSPTPVDARVMFAAFTSLHEHTNELLNNPDPTAYAREKEILARALNVDTRVVDRILLEYKDIERSKEKCK